MQEKSIRYHYYPAHQAVAIQVPYLHHVVGNKAVTPLYELKGSLALSYSAFTLNKDSHSIYLHQVAVDKLLWCKYRAQDEVYGVGILIQGKSGVGKSEAALELIERGHRLIADDVVEVRNLYGNSLVGRGGNQQLAHHMEIRGLGIINISHLYGIGAVMDQKEIHLVVTLEEWDNDKEYNRLGTDENTTEILGVQIPALTIPVKPGRNIPIIIETGAMNERLKSMGYFSAKEFDRRTIQWLEAKNISSFYNNEHKYGEE